MVDFHHGMRALSAVAMIYEKFRGSGISLQIASQRITNWKWSQSICSGVDDFANVLKPINYCSREEAFSCIAACESGSVDLSPTSLNAVMAISNGKSLYVAESLVRDPWDSELPVPVDRFMGNLGRPGMVLMIAPEQPRVTKLDEGTWRLINHREFDGSHENMFQQLTLHLSISEWQQSIGTSSIGNRDIEACFVNGIVGLHDQGTWIADLDILGMMFGKEQWIQLYPVLCYCKTQTFPGTEQYSFPWALSCIDRWEELIESPLSASIIRARGNWQARLALTTLSIQLGHTTYIVSPDHCWRCCTWPYSVIPPDPYQCFRGQKTGRMLSEFGFNYWGTKPLPSETGSLKRNLDVNSTNELADNGLSDDHLLDDQLSDDELPGDELSDANLSDEREQELSKRRPCDVYIW
ncbi:hypothetical protein EV356DRAFT_531335 [Viridothelium virens]|uniref:Uncharacterized protein n=1 Tax=Viridothelium virens TaxID=1048519 RepID=A0A6A6HE30_VIRVR|nr:hypothetical protein EV356DRAFT_531335 [Viridothelium virens]